MRVYCKKRNTEKQLNTHPEKDTYKDTCRATYPGKDTYRALYTYKTPDIQTYSDTHITFVIRNWAAMHDT